VESKTTHKPKKASILPIAALRKYVLLCRAVCGEMYYTEKEVHRDAPEQAVQECLVISQWAKDGCIP